MTEAPANWRDARIDGTRFGPVYWYSTVDSTNRYVLDAAADGAAAGLVAVADKQSAGRGRLGRSWHAPPGASLLVSVLLRPELPPDRWPMLTLVAALAAADAVATLSGVEAGIKWPNDLVVDDRKLAGLLAEAVPAGALVVGMGLNVNWSAVPPELDGIATAINLSGGRPVSRQDLLAEWLVNFDSRLTDLDGAIAQARSRSATIGRRVRIELAAETFEALATGVDEAGCLVVQRDDGRATHVAAGDVIHVRAG